MAGAGIGGGGLVVKIEDNGNGLVMDKTFNEIWEAYTTGKAVVCVQDFIQGEEYAYSILSIGTADLMIELSGEVSFYADSEDGYPTVS